MYKIQKGDYIQLTPAIAEKDLHLEAGRVYEVQQDYAQDVFYVENDGGGRYSTLGGEGVSIQEAYEAGLIYLAFTYAPFDVEEEPKEGGDVFLTKEAVAAIKLIMGVALVTNKIYPTYFSTDSMTTMLDYGDDGLDIERVLASGEARKITRRKVIRRDKTQMEVKQERDAAMEIILGSIPIESYWVNRYGQVCEVADIDLKRIDDYPDGTMVKVSMLHSYGYNSLTYVPIDDFCRNYGVVDKTTVQEITRRRLLQNAESFFREHGRVDLPRIDGGVKEYKEEVVASLGDGLHIGESAPSPSPVKLHVDELPRGIYIDAGGVRYELPTTKDNALEGRVGFSFYCASPLTQMALEQAAGIGRSPSGDIKHVKFPYEEEICTYMTIVHKLSYPAGRLFLLLCGAYQDKNKTSRLLQAAIPYVDIQIVRSEAKSNKYTGFTDKIKDMIYILLAVFSKNNSPLGAYEVWQVELILAYVESDWHRLNHLIMRLKTEVAQGEFE